MSENNKEPHQNSKNKNRSEDVIFYNNLSEPKKGSQIASDGTDPEGGGKGVKRFKKIERKPPRMTEVDADNYKPKLTLKRKILNGVCIGLAVVMILMGTGCITMFNYLSRINYQELDSSVVEKSTQSSGNNIVIPNPDVSVDSTSSLPKTNAYSGTLLNDPMVLNIMLFGADTRAGEETGQSDTMILFSIDTRHKKLKMLSFMRDTYVDIPGYESQKLNASYTFGGASLAVNTIQRNYGIQIDRYAVVDFTSFKNIINVMGGIDVDLTEEEIDYINWQCWINDQNDYKYADSDSKEYVRENLKYEWINNVPESEKPLKKSDYTFTDTGSGDKRASVHLNGRQALWQARNRGEDGICSGDDYERTRRQRQVLGIVINNMKKVDFATLLNIIYEIGPMITTNLKTSEITALATNATKYLKYDVISRSAPMSDQVGVDFYYSDDGVNSPVYVNGEEVSCIVIIDWNAFRQKVATFIFEEQVQTTG